MDSSESVFTKDEESKPKVKKTGLNIEFNSCLYLAAKHIKGKSTK
jgi:hypothetical protein